MTTAFTVLQPWAWAIIHGGKTVENRSWRTVYRGQLWVHAARSRARLGELDQWLERFGVAPPRLSQLTFGTLLGHVEVVDCRPFAEIQSNWWAEGPWCWVLENPVALPTPIALPGRQMLWRVPDAALPTPLV
jgi:ASCH domain